MATVKYKFDKITYYSTPGVSEFESVCSYYFVEGIGFPHLHITVFAPEKVTSCPKEIILQTGTTQPPTRPVRTPYSPRRR